MSNINPYQKLVVVLGMHRSGTSAITRALTTMGVELGETLGIMSKTQFDSQT